MRTFCLLKRQQRMGQEGRGKEISGSWRCLIARCCSSVLFIKGSSMGQRSAQGFPGALFTAIARDPPFPGS